MEINTSQEEKRLNRTDWWQWTEQSLAQLA